MRKRFLYHICSLLLLLRAFSVSGQTDIDSLKELLRDHPQADTVRVGLLINWMMDAGMAQESATEDSLTVVIMQLSDKLHYTRGKVVVLLDSCEKIAGPQSMAFADSILTLAERSGDKALISYALANDAAADLWLSKPIDLSPKWQRALDVAIASGDSLLIELVQEGFAYYLESFKQDYVGTLDHYLDALAIAEKRKPDINMALVLAGAGSVYKEIGDSVRALQYTQRALGLARTLRYKYWELMFLQDIGDIYLQMKDYSLALPYYLQALPQLTLHTDIERTDMTIADVYSRTGRDRLALWYGEDAWRLQRQSKDTLYHSGYGALFGRVYLQEGMIDSALYYAKWGYANAVQLHTLYALRDNAEVLADAYRAKKDDAHALEYYTLFIGYRDSTLNQDVLKKTRQRQYSYDLGKKQSVIDLLNKDNLLRKEQSRRQRIALIAVLGGLLLIGVLLFVLSRNNRQRRRGFRLLQQQKQEIQDQRDQTAQALRELRATQAQLIQSEKMASLGELTAGVAHEIQNPLNFVNNFSDVNVELLAELSAGALQSLTGPAREEAEGYITDISDNVAKIAAHGRRAESIVKDMLVQARATAWAARDV